MNLLKRLNNLWNLSRFETNVEGTYSDGTRIAELIQKPESPRMAQIVNMKSAKDKFLETNKE